MGVITLDTRFLMKKYNIRPSKSLGQNFLIDIGIVRNIAMSATVCKDDLVIEVGPGLGVLTEELAKAGGMVVAVELDRHLLPVLKDNLAVYDNVFVLNRDILKTDIKKDIFDSNDVMQKCTGCGFNLNDAVNAGRVKIVANLPYYITTPVVMSLLEQELPADCMVFMVQTEVADRMAAPPGGKDYGALSVAVQYYSSPRKLFTVHPHSFIPQPGVESTVVRLDILRQPPVELFSREVFFKTVKAAFGQRRKTLLNALYNSCFFNISKEEIKNLLESLGIEENRRGETLSIRQFADISNRLANK